MKFALLILMSFVFAFSTTLNSCGEEKESNNGFGKTLSIKELQMQKTEPGIYSVEGFLTKIYHCPPCPPFSKCAPCRRANSIAVSAENSISENNDPTEGEILLHTEDPKSFEKGKKYIFKIELTDKKLPNDPEFKYIKLIDYKLLN